MPQQSQSDDAARRILAELIEVHASAIVDLKVRMNTYTLIARLPSEILADIFAWCISITPVRRGHSTLSHSWIMVTHVCHYWREVALNTPRLWSNITFGSRNIERVQAFLARSKQARLYVEGAELSKEWLSVLSTIITQLPRIVTLQLTLSRHHVNAIADSLPPSAPVLKSLYLSEGTGFNGDTLPVSSTVSFTRPSEAILPKCAMPALEGLSLVVYSPPRWSSLGLPSSLRHLIIHNVVGLIKNTEGVGAAVDALRNVPLLEFLHLRNTLRISDTTTALPCTTSRVVLPHLRTIDLNGDAVLTAQLFERLSVPADAKVSLCLFVKSREMPLLTPLFHSHIDTPIRTDDDKQPIDVVSLGTHRAGGTSFFKRTGDPEVPNVACSDPHLSIFSGQNYILSDNIWSNHRLGWLEKTFPFSSVRDVSTFEISRDVPDPSTLANMLRSMPNIEAFHLFTVNLVSVTPIISKDGSSSEYFMPKLKAITLQAVEFRAAGEDFDGEVERFRDATHARTAAGHRLETICINLCRNMDERDVEMLEGCAEEVKWDGFVKFEGEPPVVH
ncbi:hypothetical protein BXZ70DRAFT_476311 [Cristinia sonorae]|uniref:F-box domain-containing protein n=1 Tax=Cristinia sonorae TaxID=1940300 RepID=A0A8K0UI07_9AGAR|nr:hypothetical protein BXZ70DRAFT_476311 [Cristinia sonorae]